MSKALLCGLAVVLLAAVACSDDGETSSDGTLADVLKEGDGCEPECAEGEVCIEEGAQDTCVDKTTLAGGTPCLADDDCPSNQGCLDLGNNERACQLLCEVGGEQNICDGVCFEIDGRGFCGCGAVSLNCGDVFCINGPKGNTSFCGPCRSSGDIVFGTISDQCCGPNDNDACTELYNDAGLRTASNLASCVIPEGAQTGVCGIEGEFGVNFECIENRDCAEGQTCIAEFGEPCGEAGLDDAGRCLFCQ